LLDARSILLEAFSWTALKRTLRRGEIAIEDIARFLGWTSTVSLAPDPISLKLKVILFGDRLPYFFLAALDPEMVEHFKVLADFENDFARTPENEAILARLVSTLARRDGLKPLDRDAVALVLEHCAPRRTCRQAFAGRRKGSGRPDRGGLQSAKSKTRHYHACRRR
jgi:predicted ATP-dependent protease